MDNKKILSARKRQVEQMCKQFIKKAESNDSVCYFSDIPDDYEPLNKSSKCNNDIRQSYRIKERVNICSRSLISSQLRYAIEDMLESDLKKFLINRSASKILENGMYEYWHNEAKREVHMLTKHLDRNQIKIYVYGCYHNYDKKRIAKFMNENSTLRVLLIERERLRNHSHKSKTFNKRISKEWARVTDILPLEHIVSYALDVIKINNLKLLTDEGKST